MWLISAYTPPVVAIGVRNVDASRGDKVRKLDGKSAEWKNAAASIKTTGHRPTCAHDANPVPAIVLDPFAGSGTTLLVARRLGRIGLGFDLSLAYLRECAAERLGHNLLRQWGRGIRDGNHATATLPLFDSPPFRHMPVREVGPSS